MQLIYVVVTEDPTYPEGVINPHQRLLGETGNEIHLPISIGKDAMGITLFQHQSPTYHASYRLLQPPAVDQNPSTVYHTAHLCHFSRTPASHEPLSGQFQRNDRQPTSASSCHYITTKSRIVVLDSYILLEADFIHPLGIVWPNSLFNHMLPIRDSVSIKNTQRTAGVKFPSSAIGVELSKLHRSHESVKQEYLHGSGIYPIESGPSLAHMKPWEANPPSYTNGCDIDHNGVKRSYMTYKYKGFEKFHAAINSYPTESILKSILSLEAFTKSSLFGYASSFALPTEESNQCPSLFSTTIKSMDTNHSDEIHDVGTRALYGVSSDTIQPIMAYNETKSKVQDPTHNQIDFKEVIKSDAIGEMYKFSPRHFSMISRYYNQYRYGGFEYKQADDSTRILRDVLPTDTSISSQLTSNTICFHKTNINPQQSSQSLSPILPLVGNPQNASLDARLFSHSIESSSIKTPILVPSYDIQLDSFIPATTHIQVHMMNRVIPNYPEMTHALTLNALSVQRKPTAREHGMGTDSAWVKDHPVIDKRRIPYDTEKDSILIPGTSHLLPKISDCISYVKRKHDLTKYLDTLPQKSLESLQSRGRAMDDLNEHASNSLNYENTSHNGNTMAGKQAIRNHMITKSTQLDYASSNGNSLMECSPTKRNQAGGVYSTTHNDESDRYVSPGTIPPIDSYSTNQGSTTPMGLTFQISPGRTLKSILKKPTIISKTSLAVSSEPHHIPQLIPRTMGSTYRQKRNPSLLSIDPFISIGSAISGYVGAFRKNPSLHFDSQVHRHFKTYMEIPVEIRSKGENTIQPQSPLFCAYTGHNLLPVIKHTLDGDINLELHGGQDGAMMDSDQHRRVHGKESSHGQDRLLLGTPIKGTALPYQQEVEKVSGRSKVLQRGPRIDLSPTSTVIPRIDRPASTIGGDWKLAHVGDTTKPQETLLTQKPKYASQIPRSAKNGSGIKWNSSPLSTLPKIE
ncbi:hypothetical protein BASA50_005427 [Batrachochytrium salamandrivorans]|uniref:Uncharacterized protein n=1 Tax=Batrachochytrium salamandrivorans TaxID=1357716 RepID=A0ABQ8FG13_9FUNG|nr:hypothetical protein BASA50_005427 [Batrachochytrium salamandrivorans]